LRLSETHHINRKPLKKVKVFRARAKPTSKEGKAAAEPWAKGKKISLKDGKNGDLV